MVIVFTEKQLQTPIMSSLLCCPQGTERVGLNAKPILHTIVYICTGVEFSLPVLHISPRFLESLGESHWITPFFLACTQQVLFLSYSNLFGSILTVQHLTVQIPFLCRYLNAHILLNPKSVPFTIVLLTTVIHLEMYICVSLIGNADKSYSPATVFVQRDRR